MKIILVFLLLIVLVVCPLPESEREERKKKRKEFQKQVTQCILKSDEISEHLRKELEDNNDDGELRKVLHLFATKLNENDREVIRKCRREYFSKIRDFHREKYHQRFHRNYTHHLPDEHDDDETPKHPHRSHDDETPKHPHHSNDASSSSHSGPFHHHKHGPSASSSGSAHPSGSARTSSSPSGSASSSAHPSRSAHTSAHPSRFAHTPAHPSGSAYTSPHPYGPITLPSASI